MELVSEWPLPDEVLPGYLVQDEMTEASADEQEAMLFSAMDNGDLSQFFEGDDEELLDVLNGYEMCQDLKAEWFSDSDETQFEDTNCSNEPCVEPRGNGEAQMCQTFSQGTDERSGEARTPQTQPRTEAEDNSLCSDQMYVDPSWFDDDF